MEQVMDFVLLFLIIVSLVYNMNNRVAPLLCLFNEMCYIYEKTG
jgi:hypothetical protein